eukprot:TRINITY_DN36051_c0_g1_i3.p1 TRINITY_DN36051_c0_g1~~TRINITY_DN36051_c0_g1_i3.p1  ORF type:complete len:384 (-),score=72.25 TRINITY_DN36051_c0_g1_i3:212-1363(-)
MGTSTLNEEISAGKPAVLGFLLGSYRTLPGTVSPPRLERELKDAKRLLDLRDDADAMQMAQAHLLSRGFTASPSSRELVGLLNEVPAEDLIEVGSEYRKCIGLSKQQLLDVKQCSLSPYVASIVLASVAQLESILPKDALVLGPLEGTFRGQRGGISWLHNDEHRTAAVHLGQTLFPLLRPGLCVELAESLAADMFQNYAALKGRLVGAFPELHLPEPFAWDDDGEASDWTDVLPSLQERLRSLTDGVIAAIDEYNATRKCSEDALVLDFVNVWIPMERKQLVLLPVEHSRGAIFQKDTRPSVEEVQSAGYKDDFEAFAVGTSVMFFGRYVLHQVADGPEFTKCDKGSMETRYLVILPRKSSHRFALCRESCLAPPPARESVQ